MRRADRVRDARSAWPRRRPEARGRSEGRAARGAMRRVRPSRADSPTCGQRARSPAACPRKTRAWALRESLWARERAMANQCLPRVGATGTAAGRLSAGGSCGPAPLSNGHPRSGQIRGTTEGRRSSGHIPHGPGRRRQQPGSRQRGALRRAPLAASASRCATATAIGSPCISRSARRWYSARRIAPLPRHFDPPLASTYRRASSASTSTGSSPRTASSPSARTSCPRSSASPESGSGSERWPGRGTLRHASRRGCLRLPAPWVAKSENPRGTRGFGAGATPEKRKRGRLPRGMSTAGGHAPSMVAGGRAGSRSRRILAGREDSEPERPRRNGSAADCLGACPPQVGMPLPWWREAALGREVGESSRDARIRSRSDPGETEARPTASGHVHRRWACPFRGGGRPRWVAKSENPRGTRGFGAGATPEKRKRGRLPRGMSTAGGHARSVVAGGRAGRTRWPSCAPRWAVRTT